MQNQLEETSKLTYDERKKILHQVKSSTTENKSEEVKEGEEVKESELFSTVKSSMEVEYTEKGIRLAYANLVNEKEAHDKNLIDLNNGLKDAGEMTPELQKLKDDMAKIAKIDKADKSKKQIEATEERLKFLNGEIKDLKEAIGTRLKL